MYLCCSHLSFLFLLFYLCKEELIMNSNTLITRQLVDDEQRIEQTARLFGIYFPLRLEPAVYALAGIPSSIIQSGS